MFLQWWRKKAAYFSLEATTASCDLDWGLHCYRKVRTRQTSAREMKREAWLSAEQEPSGAFVKMKTCQRAVTSNGDLLDCNLLWSFVETHQLNVESIPAVHHVLFQSLEITEDERWKAYLKFYDAHTGPGRDVRCCNSGLPPSSQLRGVIPSKAAELNVLCDD